MSKLLIYVVRHGQTFFNKYRRFQGWSDIDLTENGINHAEQAGERLANITFDKSYSSDLRRAQKTAELILQKNINSETQLTKLKAFREEFFGSFEGLGGEYVIPQLDNEIQMTDRAYDELIKKHSVDGTMDLFKIHDVSGDAENADEFWHRVEAGFETIINDNKTNQNVLIVAHGTLIRALASHYGKAEWSYQAVANGGVSILEIDIENKRKKMTVFNDSDTIW